MLNDRRLDQVSTLMAEAFEEVMGHYGPKLTRTSVVTGELDLAAIIGFAGDRASGTLAIVTSLDGATTLRRVAKVTTPDADWLMELSNQVLGLLKRKLMARGEHLNGGIPTLVEGRRLAVRLIQPELVACTRVWNYAHVCISLQIGVLLADDFGLSEPHLEAAIDQGEAIVFGDP